MENLKDKRNKMIELIDQALYNDGELLLIAGGNEDIAVAIQGDLTQLVKALVQAMREENDWLMVLEIALQTYSERYRDGDSFNDFMKGLKGFKPLDCENCVIADECEIRDEIHCSKDLPENLESIINKMFKKRKEG